MAEELFELKNYFYLGNYANAVTEGETVVLDNERNQIERDVILKRIELNQLKYDQIIESIDETSNDTLPAMKVMKYIAKFHKQQLSKEELSNTITELLKVEIEEHLNSPGFIVMCCIGYVYGEDYDNALRTANKRGNELEELSIKIQILIKMDRLDIADKEIKKMLTIDEDNTLSQLSQAFIHLCYGSQHHNIERIQEALYIYQDLLERHGATDSILNGIAICHIASFKSDQAEKVLSEALTKNLNCSTSLINVICSSAYRNKPSQLISKYFEQLISVAPNNQWLLQYHKKEKEFDELAQQFGVV